VGLVFWAAINRRQISRDQSRTVFRLLLVQAVALPLYLFVLTKNLIFMSQIGDFQKGEQFHLWSNLTKAFGIAFDWQARAYLLFSLAMILVALFHKPGLFRRFPTIFAATCLFFFSFVLALFEAKVFEARFILAFVLPFAVWMIDGAFYLARGNYQRWGAGLVLGVLFVIFPLQSHKAIYRTVTMNLQDFDDFIKVVRSLTNPIEKNCYFFSGKRDLSIFAKDFYFQKAKETAYAGEGHVSCKSYYHVRIEPHPQQEEVNLVPPPRTTELWNNRRGMALYFATHDPFVAARD
jgi:hypothetical protein